MKLEDALISVWRQTLAEGEREVKLDGRIFSVNYTPKKHLCEVDFEFGGERLHGLEQNPKTASRWAQLARAGRMVMQFSSNGRHVANVVDGKVTLYQRSELKKPVPKISLKRRTGTRT
ncbi:MAG: hypothetical protein WAM96_18730 [Candidatus Acidiferrales bacterium]